MALERAALAATQFVEGVAFANSSAKESVLASGQAKHVGPQLRLGENTVARVVIYPARVQATFEGKPIFAEKVEPVVGVEISTQVRKDGALVDVTKRYPYTPGFKDVPSNIVASLAEGITNRVI